MSAPRIGISSCLLGRTVRFDGGHKKDDFLTGTFGRFVEWVEVCPEVEVGMGTPREAVRLVREGDGPARMVGVRSGEDWSERMRAYAAGRVEALAGDGLSGYVLKKSSPSCGMERVKVYAGAGAPARNGRGLFAEALLARFPNLPVEEEGRLCDPRLRENFVERVFAYRRLRELLASDWTAGDLVAFHARHKLQLLAHSPKAYRELGGMVANVKGADRAGLARRYEDGFMDAMKAIATPGRNANVLNHVAGYFKKVLDPPSRSELAAVIDDYRHGLIPLIVPITLLKHHLRIHPNAYLDSQTYLDPHPRELMLRNHS